MFGLFYNYEMGPINKVLDAVGLSRVYWLSNSKVVLTSVIVPEIWQRFGLFFVITLAALMTIPEELFEVATIDGASSFRIFWNITIPIIWDVIQVCIVLAVTYSFRSFAIAWALTEGGPGFNSAYISILMFKTAFVSYRMGYGSAITTTILLFAIVFTILFKKFTASKY
jgi:raffinose/stachyose/melibiose transport system permease protein